MNQGLKQIRLGLDKNKQSVESTYQPEHKRLGVTPIPRQAKAYTQPSNALLMNEMQQDETVEYQATRAVEYNEVQNQRATSLAEVPFGDYVLMLTPNKIIMHSSSRVEIESNLNEFLSSQDEAVSEIVNSLIVLRKLSLSVGAHISNSDD